MTTIELPEFEASLRSVLGNAEDTDFRIDHVLSSVQGLASLSDVPAGTTVIVRADLDSAIFDGKVVDYSRIDSCLQTINYGIEHGWKVVLIAHLGRSGASIMPVRNALSERLGREVTLISDWISQDQSRLTEEMISQILAARAGDVLLCENVRRYEIEQALWEKTNDFAAIAATMWTLATNISDRLSDIYVNEAIAASNPDFSSAALPLTMSRVALGSFLSEELHHLAAVQQSDTVFMSGLKANKLDDLQGMLSRPTVHTVMVAGMLAMSLKKAEANLSGDKFSMGLAELDTGAPYFVSPKRVAQAEKIIELCRSRNVRLILPSDFVVDDGSVCASIPSDREPTDIGPQSIKRFISELKRIGMASSAANSGHQHILFYNGVPGKFEESEFAGGTRAIIATICTLRQHNIRVYVGGGEGRLALVRYGRLDDVTHAFTAGGTVLKALAGHPLPFLESLVYTAHHTNSEEYIAMPETQRPGLAEPLLQLFAETQDAAEIERLADDLSELGDPRAIPALLARLGDQRVQDDADTEDAVCSALVRFGVMEKLGNLNFRLHEASLLPDDVNAWISSHRSWIPSKYLSA